ncbi:MAG: 50S ribosomal protein L3 N(5)-glutamine methyltransferase, partial [Halioglobus sp.]|nr:50S ribosomal protein L3 N(5)-glutamine methyltransferase [Halioglobus sp.]
PVTVASALNAASLALEQAGVCFGHGTDNPWDEAVQLVLAIAGLPPDADNSVLDMPLDTLQVRQLQALLGRRIDGRVPLPYLLGRAWFAGLEFRCDERALVPRSPLAELILEQFAPWYCGPPPRRILDLCCGGGCIGLATAYYCPDVQVDLADVDAAALDLAQENTRLHDLEARVRIVPTDVFSALAGERYDIILCNPPYVDAQDLADMPAEYRAEPALGLGSGQDGLDLTRRILAEAGQHLESHGLLFLEVGNSAQALEAAFPDVPFTWVEFARGGHGVFALTATEWQDYSASWGRSAV